MGERWVEDNNRVLLISDDDDLCLPIATPIEKLPIKGHMFLRIASIF